MRTAFVTTDLLSTPAAFAPRAMLTTTRAAREALRRGLGLTPVRRLSGTTGGASGAPAKPKDGRRQAEEMTPEQIEELSVFRATGGLVMAATGGIGVFVIGAAATLGVASGAAHLLGARQPRTARPRARPLASSPVRPPPRKHASLTSDVPSPVPSHPLPRPSAQDTA